jgi:hypothetical protein
VVKSEAEAARVERARRAAFSIELTANTIASREDAPPSMVMVHFGIHNIGNRRAEHAVVNDVFPPAAGLDKPTNEQGDGRGAGNIATTDHDFGQGVTRTKYWNREMDTLSQRTHYIQGHLLLRDPAPGTHPVDVSVDHEDLPDDHSMRERWELTVPESGTDVVIRRVDTDASASPRD